MTKIGRFDTIITQHVQLVSDEGKVCANLRAGPDGSFSFFAGDGLTKAGVMFGVLPDGSPTLALQTAHELYRILLQGQDNEDKSVGLYLMDGDNKDRVSITLGCEGPQVLLNDSRGRPRVLLQLSPEGEPRIELLDEEANTSAAL